MSIWDGVKLGLGILLAIAIVKLVLFMLGIVMVIVTI